MQFEVEQKHRLDPDDAWPFAIRLAARGAHLGEPILQSDQYFAHPCRDFAKTDEAVRIRTSDGRSYITYKGPKLDKSSKTRHEIEIALSSADPDGSHLSELLQALGFTPVAVVEKSHSPFRIMYVDREIEGAYDVVGGLGVFIELELLADEASLESAKAAIKAAAGELELGPSERRSYLELLRAK